MAQRDNGSVTYHGFAGGSGNDRWPWSVRHLGGAPITLVNHIKDPTTGTLTCCYADETGAITVRSIWVPAGRSSPMWALTERAGHDNYTEYYQAQSGDGWLVRRRVQEGTRHLALIALAGETLSVEGRAGDTMRIRASLGAATLVFALSGEVPFRPEYAEWMNLDRTAAASAASDV